MGACIWFTQVTFLVVNGFSAESSSGPDGPMRGFDFQTLSRIDVLFVLKDETFRTAITPKTIERVYHDKVSVKKTPKSEIFEVLCDFIRSVSTRDVRHGGDIRYALFGYDIKGVRLFSLYLDYPGEDGFLDEQMITTSPAIKPWLDNNVLILSRK